jgi:hypothetical protein
MATHPTGWLERAPFAGWSDGVYQLATRQPGNFVAVDVPLETALNDVQVKATFHKLGGPPGGGYGLILRDAGSEPLDGVNQTGRYYVLEAGDRREAGIWRRDGDQWVDLQAWTSTPAIRAGGASNELLARATGSHLSLLVNGVEVASATDTTLTTGRVGVFVGGDSNVVALDSLTVSPPAD